jgi:hypothetical protein
MAEITMKTLVDNIVTFLEAGITAGDIDADVVKKGISGDIDQIAKTKKRYISVDDFGERTETDGVGSESQNHIYTVLIEIGARSYKDLSDAMDKCLDLTNQVRLVFEDEDNRQMDGMTFGLNIDPFTVEDEKYFYRGRQIQIQYNQLEDRIFNY